MNGLDPIALAPMMDLAEAARATGGTTDAGRVAFADVTTDSRAVRPGDLFIALAGENHDAHAFVPQAFQQGAVAALVSRRLGTPGQYPQVVVDDTRRALGRLAAAWRARFAIPVLALTGSNGKTTVKEMIASILATHCGRAGAALATEGNLNNDIGLPLMLLRLRERHRYGVFEMGMNAAGEIDTLTRLAAPTAALVNNAQRAHVGKLGSVEAIARAKGEIYAGLAPGGLALVNADDAFAPLWRSLNAGRRVIAFGTADGADVRGRLEGGQVRLVTPTDAFAVTLQVPGEHNARNAIAACAAAFALDVPPRAIQAGLAAYAGTPGRLERRHAANGALVIDDTYNANPDSMKAAADVLAAGPGRRVMVVGDMGELGDIAPQLHAEVGAYAKAAGIDALLAVGPLSRHAAEAFGAGARHLASIEATIDAARDESQAGATVLVKGSRSMRMERVADALAPGGSGHAA